MKTKKLLPAVAALLAVALLLQAGTTTTKHGLYKPSVGEDGWGASVNANFDTLDARLPLLDALYGFWGITDSPPTAVTTSVFAGSNNQVRAHRIFVNRRTTVRRILFELTTASASGFCSVGIYSADGSTLLAHTGAVATDATGIKNIDVTDTNLDPGVYWLAWTANNTTAQYRAISLSSAVNDIANTVAARVGIAANASSGGVLPSTLGTVSSASINPVLAFFDAAA